MPDRPGHDRRYLLDSHQDPRGARWEPEIAFEEGLAETVRWYAEQPSLVGAAARPGAGGGGRLGRPPGPHVAAA